MNAQRLIFLFITLAVVATTDAVSQGTSGRRVPEFSSRQEYVSLDSTMPFDRAIAALSEISKRFSGKIIIDVQERTSPIGIPIRGLHWRDALDLIGEANNLRVVEKADYIELKSLRELSAQQAGGTATKPVVSIDTREVLITTIIFSLNLDKSLQYGIDWSFSFLRGKDTLNGVFSEPAKTSALSLTYGRPYQYGSISAALQLFSQNGLGEIIASPRIIVRSNETGNVQVGQDISVTERTITASGVTTSVRQIPTGTIVKVTPEVIKEGDIEYVSIELNVDRSSALTTGDAPTIDKNSTQTKLLLIDGEEAFISGLYFNSESVTRTGIPILKDLPPWFFGLRYIFGSDERRTIRNELAILLRADILPTLKERASQRAKENVLEIQRKKFDEDLERLRTKNRDN